MELFVWDLSSDLDSDLEDNLMCFVLWLMEDDFLSWEPIEDDNDSLLGVPLLLWVFLLLISFLKESEELTPEDEHEDDLRLSFIFFDLRGGDGDALFSICWEDSGSPSTLFSSVDFLFVFFFLTSLMFFVLSCSSFITFAVGFEFS